MYTLPLTCTQLGIIIGTILFFTGMFLLVTQDWEPWNWYIVLGLILVLAPVFIGSILGSEQLYIYLANNVKCKCDK